MPDDPDLSPPYGFPDPEDLPTPASGFPQPYVSPYPPPDPAAQQGGYGSPWGGGPPTGDIPVIDPSPPRYLDTPAPVVGKADLDKPPADFDG